MRRGGGGGEGKGPPPPPFAGGGGGGGKHPPKPPPSPGGGGGGGVRKPSRLLHLSERQVQRLKRRYQPDSLSWVQHGNRGRAMPWAVSVPQKQLILILARGKYQGFNDSHLTEKLHGEENLAVSRETVRRILRAAKCPSPKERRPGKYRPRRPPRPRFGMMALTDASRHDWLQGRGPTLTLIGFQDDATGQILKTDQS